MRHWFIPWCVHLLVPTNHDGKIQYFCWTKCNLLLLFCPRIIHDDKKVNTIKFGVGAPRQAFNSLLLTHWLFQILSPVYRPSPPYGLLQSLKTESLWSIGFDPYLPLDESNCDSWSQVVSSLRVRMLLMFIFMCLAPGVFSTQQGSINACVLCILQLSRGSCTQH